jgi:hypothetical protein
MTSLQGSIALGSHRFVDFARLMIFRSIAVLRTNNATTDSGD